MFEGEKGVPEISNTVLYEEKLSVTWRLWQYAPF